MEQQTKDEDLSRESPPRQIPSNSQVERLKERLLAFSKAVSERSVDGMRNFRTYMRQLSRQTSFESIWWDEPTLECLGISFDDPVASYLYFQMYYQQYFESHIADPEMCVLAITNMGDLFNAFNQSSFHVDLSASWLWSIIDEFVSMFEAMHYFHHLPGPYSELSNIKPMVLLNPLNELMSTSGVLSAIKSLSTDGKVSKDLGFIRALGYYSLIGLIRYYTFDGDYAQALRLVNQLPSTFTARRIFGGNVPHCIVATSFYTALVCHFLYVLFARKHYLKVRKKIIL